MRKNQLKLIMNFSFGLSLLYGSPRMASASPFQVECTVDTSVLPKLAGTAKFGTNGRLAWVMSTRTLLRMLFSFLKEEPANMNDFTIGVLGVFKKKTESCSFNRTSFA